MAIRGLPTHREYTQQLLEHYHHPRNVGELPGADAVVTVGSPTHGDVMQLSLRITEGRVADARFKTFGCAVAIAAGSAVTELIRGMSLEEMERLSNSRVVQALGGVPENKMGCSVLDEQAIREALAVYRAKRTGGLVEVQSQEPIQGTAAGSAAGIPLQR